jgi:hypothetical protein
MRAIITAITTTVLTMAAHTAVAIAVAAVVRPERLSAELVAGSWAMQSSAAWVGHWSVPAQARCLVVISNGTASATGATDRGFSHLDVVNGLIQLPREAQNLIQEREVGPSRIVTS